jgi:hypothetical protein
MKNFRLPKLLLPNRKRREEATQNARNDSKATFDWSSLISK